MSLGGWIIRESARPISVVFPVPALRPHPTPHPTRLITAD